MLRGGARPSPLSTIALRVHAGRVREHDQAARVHEQAAGGDQALLETLADHSAEQDADEHAGRHQHDHERGLGDRVAQALLQAFAVNHASRYYGSVIKTFKCLDTEALSKGRRVKRFVNIESIAQRKLRQLQIAGRLEDLRVPPGNRLEALKGDRVGQHSIRVSDQYRICFRWTAAGAEDVEIVDYH